MDSFELTKFAGSALAALLLIVGAKTAIDISMSHPGKSDLPGYTLPLPKAEAPKADAGKGGAAPAAAAFDAAKVAAAAASGKVDNGAAVFKKCVACHTDDKGGANKVGPALFGIVGRAKASTPGFAYSDAMKAKGGNWTLEDLATFLNSPNGFAKGTKMSFSGVPDAGDLADLLAYLKSKS